MWMSVVCAATRSHVGVHGPAAAWVRLMSVVHAIARNYVKSMVSAASAVMVMLFFFQCYWWLQAHNWEWEPSTYSHSPKGNCLDRKLLKRVLKNCEIDALHSWWLLSGVGWWGRTQLSLRDRPLGVWLCSSEYMGNTNWTCVFFSLFFVEGTRVIEWAWGKWEVWSGLTV